jgi:hypothetical protein
LIERIPGRLPCGPLVNLFAGYHPCAAPGCIVHVSKNRTMCWEHGGGE